jgi:iron complex transport system ATP-binding protein
MTAILDVNDIHFSFHKPVLERVSFSGGPRELIAVLGPNGSGKSTLLKIVVGILKAEQGDVSLSGRRLQQLTRREIARQIGYVPQESNVRFPLTVLEYVLQGRFAQGRLTAFESEQDVVEAERAMRLTDTERFQSRMVNELSGGERQRVMLARAIAARPRLLVLDEPVANLDISQQMKMFDLVSRLTEEEAIAALVVTHELNLAAEFATAVLLLKRGRVAGFGPPHSEMTRDVLESVFDTSLMLDANPVTRAPRITLMRSPRRPA